MKTLLWVFLFCGIPTLLPAQTNIEIGTPAPEISFTHWLKNEPADKKLKDKFIVLDFWATWCKPCLDGIPHLNDLRAAFPREDLYFISLTSESPKTASAFFDRIDFQVSVASDVTRQTEINFGNGETGLARWPTAVLIDNRNVVRWIGDPADLTEEMMDRFLDVDLAVEPGREAQEADTGGPAWRKRELEDKWSREKYFDAFEDDDITRFVHVFPAGDLSSGTKEIDVFSLGTMAYFNATTLGDFFGKVHPEMKLKLPAHLRDQKFMIAFKNDHPSRNSSRTIIRQIIAQTGYRVAFSDGEAQRNTISVANANKLVPTVSEQKWPGCQEDDFGALQCEKQKLTDLAKELNKVTDDIWEYKGSDRRRYDFELFLSSPETILATLRGYGLKVKSRTTEVQVLRITER